MFYSTQEVAKLFCVTVPTVVRMIEAGNMPSVRMGRLYRIPKAYIDEMIQDAEDYATSAVEANA